MAEVTDYRIGDLYPVWWSTGKKVGDWNMATIISVKPYVGKLNTLGFKQIVTLTSLKGCVEMTVPPKDHICRVQEMKKFILL